MPRIKTQGAIHVFVAYQHLVCAAMKALIVVGVAIAALTFFGSKLFIFII